MLRHRFGTYQYEDCCRELGAKNQKDFDAANDVAFDEIVKRYVHFRTSTYFSLIDNVVNS